jgi:GNAT superfamily N-acetyltransferase
MPVRVATVADIDAMHRVRLAVRENVLSNPVVVTRRHYRQALEHNGRGWVFEKNGEIVGFAIADKCRRNVWALFVHPEHERQGIGRVLHDAMMAWLFEADCRPVWLGTMPGTCAEQFYLSAGWSRSGERDNGEILFEMTLERYLTCCCHFHEKVARKAG